MFRSVTLLVVLLLPLSVMAQPREWDSRGIYVGVGAGTSKVDPDTTGTLLTVTDDSDTGTKLFVGYDFDRNWALELEYVELGETATTTDTAEFTIPALSAVYSWLDHHEGWHGQVKLGVAAIDVEGIDALDRYPSSKMFAGLGLGFGFSGGWQILGEYEYFDADLDLLSLNFIKRFEFKRNLYQGEPSPNRVIRRVIDPRVRAPAPVQIQERSVGDSDGDGVNDHRDECPNTPIGASVNSVGCAIFQGVLNNVNFEHDSDALTPMAKSILQEVAVELVRFPDIIVEVQAHADSTGEDGYNLELSNRRAKSVERFLGAEGVSLNVLQPRGFGESRPIADNDTPEGRALNRRVEFHVL